MRSTTRTCLELSTLPGCVGPHFFPATTIKAPAQRATGGPSSALAPQGWRGGGGEFFFVRV